MKYGCLLIMLSIVGIVWVALIKGATNRYNAGTVEYSGTPEHRNHAAAKRLTQYQDDKHFTHVIGVVIVVSVILAWRWYNGSW